VNAPRILARLVPARDVKLGARRLAAKAPEGARVLAFNPAPGSFLGLRFNAYREHMSASGCRYADAPAKANYALEPQAAARAASALQRDGFEVVAEDAAAAEWLAGGAALLSGARRAAGAGVDRARALLAERGLAPRPYQEEGIAWLSSRFVPGCRGALLADDMRLGKTMQTLLSAPGGVVVVCPASVKGGWALEVAKWTPARAVTVLSGRGSYRHPAGDEVVVLNYEILPTEEELEALGPLPAGVTVVLDEAQAVGNSKSARTKRAKALCRAAQAVGGWALGLTGTPLSNRPLEFWSILSVLDLAAEAFGSYGRFCAAYGGFDLVRESRAVASPQALLGAAKVSMRREQRQVRPQLPPVQRIRVSVPLEGKAGEIAAQLDAIARRAVAAAQALAREPLTQEEQEEAIERAFRSSTEIGDMSANLSTVARALIPTAEELVEAAEQSGRPIVLATTSREVAEHFGAREGWGAIHGGVSATQRTETIAAFQAGQIDRVALTIRAGGAGITLSRGEEIVFVGRDWSAAANRQCEERITDLDSPDPKTITSIVGECWLSGHVEDLVAAKDRLMASTTRVLVASGGKIAEAPELAQVRVGLPPAEPKSKGISLDSDLVARLERMAARRGRLAGWLLDNFGRKGYLPSACRGTPTLAALDAEELGLRTEEEKAAAELEALRAACRPAQGAAEEHAARALEHLAGWDTDHAREQNGVGFAASTQDGHRLVAQLHSLGGLTDEQWTRALAIARLHVRQVGAPTLPHEVTVLAALAGVDVTEV
jgi:hypothetical protein